MLVNLTSNSYRKYLLTCKAFTSNLHENSFVDIKVRLANTEHKSLYTVI